MVLSAGGQYDAMEHNCDRAWHKDWHQSPRNSVLVEGIEKGVERSVERRGGIELVSNTSHSGRRATFARGNFVTKVLRGVLREGEVLREGGGVERGSQ